MKAVLALWSIDNPRAWHRTRRLVFLHVFLLERQAYSNSSDMVMFIPKDLNLGFVHRRCGNWHLEINALSHQMVRLS
jgi:hypothetical protein